MRLNFEKNISKKQVLMLKTFILRVICKQRNL